MKINETSSSKGSIHDYKTHNKGSIHDSKQFNLDERSLIIQQSENIGRSRVKNNGSQTGNYEDTSNSEVTNEKKIKLLMSRA